ncbi:MAG TPA: 5-formyltetrahydrofolate cyclo-ligase [Bacillota bacterium]|nr:5-formyltetrahydrofolate cyclo-ligase [Bacillota bacterium]
MKEKVKLREKTITYLRELSQEQRENIEEEILENLTRQTYWKQANIIGITISQDIEWNTYPIIENAWKKGKRVAVPKCIPQTKELHFYEIISFDQLETAHFSLKEPIIEQTEKVHLEKIDLLVVPGLLFDKKGYRIGFGGGYYDRLLTKYNNNTVSLLSSKQLISRVPRKSFDLPVNHLITEREAIQVFGGD